MQACSLQCIAFYFLLPEEAVLLQLPRLLRYELQRALCESHLWVSLWERPTRSPFTRLQRATCCALLLQLFLLANTLWYSIVVDKRYGCVNGCDGFFLSCLSLFVNSHHATSNECNHVLQPEGCVKVFIIKRRDSGSRRGHLSDRLPSLLACFHAVQNEPQQGNPNLTKCDIWSSFLVFQRPWIKQNISSVIVYL